MHFTYEEPDRFEADVLRQGDVLKRTEGVNALLSAIHPHYFGQEDYRYLQVLTQSCDLERRNGKPCKARYIALGAVRPMATVLDREVAKARRNPAIEIPAGIASEEQRRTIDDFTRKLLNNNQSAYFYLHEELAVDFSPAHCTFLRLSIPVRAQEHYETLRLAKILQLRSEFQAKLGWLIGDLYSRVGTMDWADHESDEAFAARVAEIVNNTTRWVERRTHEKLLRELKKQEQPLTPTIVAELLPKIKQASRKESALARIREVAKTLEIEDSKVTTLAKVLNNDPTFSQLVKD